MIGSPGMGGGVLTDWSSLMGSWTLPVFWGTQGGSNMGTQGMPRMGEGRVKFILGGGIYEHSRDSPLLFKGYWGIGALPC